MRGGLATGHAALDGFQHFVADIVAEFMWAFTAVRLKSIWPRATYCDLDMFWQF